MVPVAPGGDDAGSDAGVEEWKRYINMEAACLINDLKPAVKVSLFAGAALEAHVLNANFAAVPRKGHCCPPGMAAGGGGHHRRLDSLQPHSLVCTQAIPPCLVSPIPCGVLLRNQAAFRGKSRLLQVFDGGCCREQAVFRAVLSGTCQLSLICRVL